MSARNALFYIAGVASMVIVSCGGGGSPAAQEPQTCTGTVEIQLFGDSTQAGQGSALQVFMDKRFGRGAVTVTNLGDPGTSAEHMPLSLVKPGAITIANYGINDQRRGVSIEDYKAALRRANVSFYETSSPPWDGYAQAMRDVAAELGRPVVEVSLGVRAMPDWQQHVPDGVHPDAELYARITDQIVGPRVAQLIEARVCK